MKAQFMMSGTCLLETELDCIPPIGSVLEFTTECYKKGNWPGTVLRVTVGKDWPLKIHFGKMKTDHVIVIDCMGCEVVYEAPAPEGAG